MGDVAATKGLSIGQKVGVGWFISSCGYCDPCLNGEQNLCIRIQAAIWGNHGGWGETIRANGI
jgi:alcohol/geraniol dehydrogenase (NADP+)